jgi:hypothetical protein
MGSGRIRIILPDPDPDRHLGHADLDPADPDRHQFQADENIDKSSLFSPRKFSVIQNTENR